MTPDYWEDDWGPVPDDGLTRYRVVVELKVRKQKGLVRWETTLDYPGPLPVSLDGLRVGIVCAALRVKHIKHDTQAWVTLNGTTALVVTSP